MLSLSLQHQPGRACLRRRPPLAVPRLRRRRVRRARAARRRHVCVFGWQKREKENERKQQRKLVFGGFFSNTFWLAFSFACDTEQKQFEFARIVVEQAKTTAKIR